MADCHLGTKNRVQSFSRAFPSSTNVPVTLLSLIKLKALAKAFARVQENSKVLLNPERRKCFEFEGVIHRLALSDVLPLLGQE